MGLYPSDTTENASNGKDRNALEFGFNPQSELWNSRLAIVGFVAYLTLESQRLRRNVRITPLHTLLFPLIMLMSFS